MEHNRDLIYVKTANSSANIGLEKIHFLLYQIETISFLSTCVEIIEINKCRIIRKKYLIEQVLRQPNLKPFQFIYNLN